jgi:hypothetical protein
MFPARAAIGQGAKRSPGAHSPGGILSFETDIRMDMQLGGYARTTDAASLNGHTHEAARVAGGIANAHVVVIWQEGRRRRQSGPRRAFGSVLR